MNQFVIPIVFLIQHNPILSQRGSVQKGERRFGMLT